MKTVFCVEDDENIRELIVYAMKSAGFEATGFENAHDFFNHISKQKPSLVLLDIMLPDMDGNDILKELKKNPETSFLPVIMLTAKSQPFDKIKGLDGGADDYITKPFDVLELLSRVKAVLRRCNETGDNDAIVLKKIKILPGKRKVFVNENEVVLTYKEYELLNMLIANKGLVVSRDEIMDKIWGTDFMGETRTVDVHIRTLRQKLGEAGEYIQTVRNVGYKAE